MRRLSAIVLAGTLGFAASALAQSADPGPADLGASNNRTLPDGTGLDALTQTPPPPDYTGAILGGLGLGGLAAVVVLATQNNDDNNPDAGTNPVSP